MLETNNSYQDWKFALESFFGKNMKSLKVVELGKGEGTYFLTQNFSKTYSIEYTRRQYTATWEILGLPNHILETITPISNIVDLDNILVSSLGKIRPKELLDEATRIHTEAFKYDADILFIDHGCHNRGEVLEIAKKSKWKYIVVHDINFPYYGYNLTDDDNFNIHLFLEGNGTAIFERKLDYGISIIVPTMGRNTLLRSLYSITGQTNNNWLALVGFDGLDCNNFYTVDDQRIKYFSLKKVGGGVVKNSNGRGGLVRNALIQKSITPWVCFLDDDDTLRKEYINNFYTELSKKPDADVIVFRMSYNSTDKQVLPPKGTTSPQLHKIGISFAVRYQFLYKNDIWFENSTREDFLLLKRIEDSGGIFVFSSYIGYNINY